MPMSVLLDVAMNVEESEAGGERMEAHLLQMCTVSLLFITPEICMLTRLGKSCSAREG